VMAVGHSFMPRGFQTALSMSSMSVLSLPVRMCTCVEGGGSSTAGAEKDRPEMIR
jgi:hypothetical protein